MSSSNPPPMISIIMPAYNGSKYIGAAIESVLAQTYQAWNLIIVDDGSVDDAGAIADGFAAKDSRIRVHHQANGGIASARNKGLAELHRESRYVAFLDNDDVWEADALGSLYDALNPNPKAVGAHGCRRYVDAEGTRLRVDGAAMAPLRRRAIAGRALRVLDVDAPTTFECLAYGNCVPTSGLLVRREAVEKVGAFDARAVPADDWDMWLRLALFGSYIFVNKVLFAYRLHSANVSKDSRRKNEAMYFVRRKLYASNALTSEQRTSVLWGFRYYELYRGKVAMREGLRRFGQGRMTESCAAFARVVAHLWRVASAP